MVIKTVTIAPQYLSFYISASEDFEVPIDRLVGGIVATPDCIVVSCLYWNEGDTTITLGPFEELPPQDMPLREDCVLETPESRVLICDALVPEILTAAVPGARTRVRVWTNHEIGPDIVVIGLG